MPLFENIENLEDIEKIEKSEYDAADDIAKENNRTCFTRTKERAKSLFKYVGQAFYQGFCAPFYSFTSLKASWDTSPSFRQSIKTSGKLNGIYALTAFGLYTTYYRGWSPINHYFTGYPRIILTPIDWVLYYSMNSYLLFFELGLNFLENAAMIDIVTDTAKEATTVSDIKSCGCSDALAPSHSLFFYAANRYIINAVSYYLKEGSASWGIKIIAFLLESISFGYPLVEYKLSAVGTCTKHRLQELFLNNKAYFICFGASFVSVMWSFNYAFKNLGENEENIFLYDAVFSFLFQVYAAIAISRREKFPGGREQHIDILALLKYLSETRPPQFVFYLLKKRYSPEALATSEGIGMWVTRRETQIRTWLNTFKGYSATIEKMRTNAWLEWVLKPFFVIPPEVKSYNDYFNSKIKTTEKYFQLAINAEYPRAIREAVDSESKNVNDRSEDDVISKTTDSDDEWEDIVDTFLENKNQEKNVELKDEKPHALNSEFNDQHFECRKEAPPPIKKDPCLIVDNKPLSRNSSHLFRKRTHLSDNTKKILKEAVKQKKGLVGLTGMIVAAPRSKT